MRKQYHWSIKLIALLLVFFSAAAAGMCGLSSVHNFANDLYRTDDLSEKINQRIEERLMTQSYETALYLGHEYLVNERAGSDNQEREAWKNAISHYWGYYGDLLLDADYTISDSGGNVLASGGRADRTESDYVMTIPQTVALNDGILVNMGSALSQKEYPTFEELAEMAADGFDDLVYEQSLSVFAGSTEPVKKLGWEKMYSSMGITGFAFPLTGEAAVNPTIPVVSMPFTMCHEMAHRMCISLERDANLTGYLACIANEDPIYQYSGYFMAFRYCYNALASVRTSAASNAAKNIYAGINDTVMSDLNDYRAYLNANIKESASKVGDAVNDAYIQASGDESGIQSYGEVTDLLVSWYIQEIYLPDHKEEEVGFDPTDKNQVDLTTTTTPSGGDK